MESLIKEEVDVDATPPPAATSSSSTHSEPPQASPDNNGVPSHSPTRIPKKNQPPMTLHSNSSNNDNNTESLVLPNGVHLPPTVTPQMLDGRLRRAFLDLTPAQMRAVLEEYDESVNQKGEEIRNRVAYLFGVVKRHKVASERAQYGGGEYTPQGNTISVRVQVSCCYLLPPLVSS
jgi:hypothetical protein